MADPHQQREEEQLLSGRQVAPAVPDIPDGPAAGLQHALAAHGPAAVRLGYYPRLTAGGSLIPADHWHRISCRSQPWVAGQPPAPCAGCTPTRTPAVGPCRRLKRRHWSLVNF